jgi:aspartate carbamoyltransferase catalytic subunit
MLPPYLQDLGVEVSYSMAEAVTGADVVMMLRLQLERQGQMFFPTLREYSKFFGLNREHLQLAQPDALVMHPGPLNRGVEISPEVADGAQSAILAQVTNGVAVRMAVLYLLSGGEQSGAAA